MKKKYNNKYNLQRNRKRFKACWLGESDDEGFMSHGRLYIITEVKSTGHYAFVNNLGLKDLALATNFKAVTTPKLGRRKVV